MVDPWPNFPAGTTWPWDLSDLMSTCQPKLPSATNERTVGAISCSSFSKNGAHVSRSSVVGLFSGGAQRTAIEMRVSRNSCPSSREVDVAIFAIPMR